MKRRLAVVIPFFQRREGILRGALESVFIQRDFDDYEIVVVDDQSPVSARSELVSLQNYGWPVDRVRVLEQMNRGPAGARNTGLDNVGDIEYVAFLDSDDRWAENHLANAVTALETGNDFYFADFYQLGADVSAFNRAKRINVNDHPLLIEGTSLHKYCGDMFDQILFGNIIGTPTVVYRYSKLHSVRFCEALVSAGEDYLFWMMLVGKTDKIVFSSAHECVCGEGVNVYSGSGWGTASFVNRVHHEIKYRTFVEKMFNLTSPQKFQNRRVLRSLRLAFMKGILHALANRKPLPTRLLLDHIRLDPRSFLFIDLLTDKLSTSSSR